MAGVSVSVSGFSRRACLLCALLALAACSNVPSIAKRSRALALDEAASSYGKMIRWGYFDEAAGYLRARDGSRVAGDLDRIARYRVTAYDPLSQLVAADGLEGRVVARIEYYEIDAGVLRTLHDEQFWWYDDDANRWYLGSGLPAFGQSGG